MANIEQIVYADGKTDIVNDFKNLVKNLQESDLIEKEKTREQALFEPVQYIRKKQIFDKPVQFQQSSERIVKSKAIA